MKSGKLILGIGGKARSGKDTSCQAIIDTYGASYKIERLAFGDALKEEVNQLDQFETCAKYRVPFDFSPDMTDPLCQTKFGKQRALLQFWGQHRREQNSFYWVVNAQERAAQSEAEILIIPDMRYRNEAYWVKAEGGFTLKISRLGFQVLTGAAADHISEHDLDEYKFDYEIDVFDGQVESLRKDALVVFEHILESNVVNGLEQEEVYA